MKAAVIVVNSNGRGFLQECLESVRAQAFSHKAYLVDNGSTDGSAEFVKELFPEVEVIRLEKNGGFAKAANEGLKLAAETGFQYIALLDYDAKAEKDWLLNLVTALENDDEAGMAAPKILYRDGPMTINSAGFIKKYGQIVQRGVNATDRGQFDRKTKIFGAFDGACIYRKVMLGEAGFFDEEYGDYYGDADLAWRAKKHGWTAVFVPGALCYHKSRGGAASDTAERLKRSADKLDGLIRLIKKNGNIFDKFTASLHWTLLALSNVIARLLKLTRSRFVYAKRIKGIF